MPPPHRAKPRRGRHVRVLGRAVAETCTADFWPVYGQTRVGLDRRPCACQWRFLLNPTLVLW